MKPFLKLIIFSTILSTSMAAEYPYDGIYHCTKNTYGAAGNYISPEEKAYYFLSQDINTYNPITITIQDNIMTLGGFKEEINGETATPRVRASRRLFQAKGGHVYRDLQKGDLLYATDNMVQVFFPRIYEFTVPFLLESYQITHRFYECEKEGGNTYYFDPKEIILAVIDNNIEGKREYELAREAELSHDDKKYLDLLIQSANIGYADAMVDLGFRHELNLHYSKAHEWYRKAIQKGSLMSVL